MARRKPTIRSVVVVDIVVPDGEPDRQITATRSCCGSTYEIAMPVTASVPAVGSPAAACLNHHKARREAHVPHHVDFRGKLCDGTIVTWVGGQQCE